MQELVVPVWIILSGRKGIVDGWMRQELVGDARTALLTGNGKISVILDQKWGVPNDDALRISDIFVKIA